MTSWKRDFASGLVVLVPILVTLYVIYWLFGFVAEFALLATNIDDPAVAVALSLLVFVLLVFSVGYLMRTAVGGIVEGLIDDLINRLPILRVIYNASKMAVETVLSSSTEEFQKPVKIEPWEGMRMTAFKTGKTTDDGREVVFMPTAPNITTGFVIELEPEDIVDEDESVESALTRVLSAGFGKEETDMDDIDEYVGDE
ncbi:DUF502 domain-containing protein [Halobacterium litoreum]|uniref:DUF502 domain-containing protein n=1 Tax=Halobacterium litoreum TaxID=2039234 RepID=A0ABD5NEI9_9EURY|nr:DUF502 domain-containing protein [Halobacterium litoreum]UHH13563.1 DUF502 domain-containing protein [Halobacterium litoreum]